ncbi:Sodium/potassium-transporting ATPase subunit beta [Halotydeus destructor]|nr:Sodium/potassium-transporting ATPase subunit beta [Halotydeus destructor]
MSKDEKEERLSVPIAEEEDVDEPNEKSPLKQDSEQVLFTSGETPNVAITVNGKNVKDDDDAVRDLKYLLTEPRSRFLIVTAGVIAFAVISIIATVIAVNVEQEIWYGDDMTPRMLKLVPSPKGPQNMIRYVSGRGAEGSLWPELVKQLNETLDSYSLDGQNNTGKESFTACDTVPSDSDNLTCLYPTEPIKLLCNQRDNFGYPVGIPCIFIQINHRQLFNWTPQLYTSDDLKNIQELPPVIRNTYRTTGPYLECKGNTIVDVENAGEIKFSPNHEYHKNYFPYKGHPDYMAPLIAIKLIKPKTGIVIGITCRLYAKNIGPYDLIDPLTNTTTRVSGDKNLPSAELPFNIYIE